MNLKLKKKHPQSRWLTSLLGLTSLALPCFQGLAAEASAEPTPQTVQTLSKLSLADLMNIKVSSVYSASKFQQKVSEAPSSVSIITSEDIKQYGHRTMFEILNSVRGFQATHERNYGFVGVRGINRPGDFGGRTLILVNGHRLNEPLYDSSFPQYDFILDVDLIDRIEVVRGSGSALYGNNAFFAVINVITKNPSDIGGAEVSGAWGRYDSYNGRVTYGNSFKNGIQMTLSGSAYTSQGVDTLYFREYDTPAQNNGRAEGLDGEESYSGFFQMSYKDFTLESGVVNRNKEVPTAIFDTLFNRRNTSLDRRAYTTLKYNHEFSNGLQVIGRVYYDYYKFLGRLPYNTGLFNDLSRSQGVGGEIQIIKDFFEKHRVTFGTEYRHDYELTLNGYTSGDRANADYNLDDNQDVFSAYLQDQYTILDNLILNAGVRFDDYSTFGNTTNPRVALIYSPFEKSTFKFIYGEAYRAPNDSEFRLESAAQGVLANNNLGAEEIRSYEFIYEQELPKNLRFSSSVYLNQISDLIAQVDNGAGQLIYDNLSGVDAQGVEFELEGRWSNGLRGRLSYALQETEDDDTGNKLTNSPQHLGKLNLVAPIFKDNIFAGFEVQTVSSRTTLAGNRLDSYWIANANLFSRDLIKNLEVSFGIYNLFDREFYTPAHGKHLMDIIPQDRRTYRVKLTYRF